MLLALASRSGHPKSQTIAALLVGTCEPATLDSRETSGRGVEATVSGAVYRLGAPRWAAPVAVPPPAGDLVLARDGVILLDVETRERLRVDAVDEVGALTLAGYEVWILSGDRQRRVDAVAGAVGVPAARALGDLSAEDKAEWLAQHDRRDTLMIGDGINDLQAVAAAFCSGTPAVDRPFVASRADFYFVSPGLRPVRAALAAGRRLARVVQMNLGVAVAYNVVAVALVFAGVMSPVVCAVLMPLSSLSTIAATKLGLSERSRPWRS